MMSNKQISISKAIRDLLLVQQSLNQREDEYNKGMFNGIELALCLLQKDKKPNYKEIKESEGGKGDE
jgi:hypothetical protein